MSKIKVAVIGCGNIANSAHIPAYMKNNEVEIKYFCDIIPERAEKCVEKYGCGIAVADYHDFLNDPEIDAVSVCTHNDFHSIIAIDFLRAGKHVLCEKPAARVLSEALEMQKVAHETGKILNIGVVNRFNTYVMKIRELIENGELGEVYHVYASFRSHRSIPGIGGDFTIKAKAGGGALIDWGVHFLDLVLYCCGDPKPVTASGEAFCKLGKDIKNYTYTSMWAEDTADMNGTYDVDDSVVGIVRTTGPVISFNGAWAQNIGEREMHIDFMGDKAGIRLEYCSDFRLWSVKNGMLTETKVSAKETNMYENEINDFIRCIKTGDKNQQYIDYAVETSKILQAVYDSSESHSEIKIS
ncbi:MAG: Gfo/Idh/MocA family oxidoreductase [Clostridia bacterium]|nr:Gfo/Idh/MocA family oxidoreductase [Clostridia bacterium]MBQ3007640.1 Gfo/Idh/MocA family oxidoreductase [Clostridia bacterium]